MSYLELLLLGVVQGLTEFLPVSSSGHLVLAQHLIGLEEPQVFFDLVLHLGTLVATIVFFRAAFRDMARDGARGLGDLFSGHARGLYERPGSRLLLLVSLGSIPTALIGLGLRHEIEAMFASPRMVAWMLLFTAAVLLATLLAPRKGRSLTQMGARDALLIGLAQGIAITPGISRSGMTIAVGLLLGLDRELAARFSFVLGVPAILGAFLLEAAKGGFDSLVVSQAVFGFVVAVVFGLAALVALMPVVRRGRLHLFSGYLVALAVVALWWIGPQRG